MRSKILIMIMSLVMMRRGEAPAPACSQLACMAGILAAIGLKDGSLASTQNFTTLQTLQQAADMEAILTILKEESTAAQVNAVFYLGSVVLSVYAGLPLVSTAAMTAAKLFANLDIVDKFYLAQAIGRYMHTNKLNLDDTEIDPRSQIMEIMCKIKREEVSFGEKFTPYSYWTDLINLVVDGQYGAENPYSTRVRDFVEYTVFDNEKRPLALPIIAANYLHYLGLAVHIYNGETQFFNSTNADKTNAPVELLAKALYKFAEYYGAISVTKKCPHLLKGQSKALDATAINKTNYEEIRDIFEQKHKELWAISKKLSLFYSIQLQEDAIATTQIPAGNARQSILQAAKNFIAKVTDSSFYEKPTEEEKRIQQHIQKIKSTIDKKQLLYLESQITNTTTQIQSLFSEKEGRIAMQYTQPFTYAQVESMTRLNNELRDKQSELELLKFQTKLTNLVQRLNPTVNSVIEAQEKEIDILCQALHQHINFITALMPNCNTCTPSVNVSQLTEKLNTFAKNNTEKQTKSLMEYIKKLKTISLNRLAQKWMNTTIAIAERKRINNPNSSQN